MSDVKLEPDPPVWWQLAVWANVTALLGMLFVLAWWIFS